MFAPNEIAQNVIGIGKKKASLSACKMFLLGIMAGMFIAMAAVGANTASCLIENPGIAKLVSGATFPVGLIMVLIAGSELFTGNSLIIVSVLAGEVKISQMLKNWLFVYLGNMVGSMLVAGICCAAGQYDLFAGVLAVTTIKTAAAKCSLDFGKAILLGFMCNIFVCVAVWMSFGAKTVGGKIAAIFMPVMMFVVCGFEHCVANMYYIPAGLFALLNPQYAELSADVSNVANLTWGNFFARNLLPVTIGNVLGGVIMVGVMYWLIYLKKEKTVKF